MPSKSNYSKFIVLLLIALLLYTNFHFFPGNIIAWDVFGYYLYLPLTFIYHDLGIKDPEIINGIIAKYNSTATFYQAMQMPGGVHVLKYSMGMSFFYAPFFFIAHALAAPQGFPADGFSLPYQWAMLISAIVWSIVGLLALRRVLLHFFNDKITAVVLLLIFFGTNYLFHITMYGQNAMSHNYLFSCYALIIWLSIKWHRDYKLKYIIGLALVCGIAILSRPSEIVCLLIPAFWGVTNRETLVNKWKLLLQYKGQIITFGVILFVFGSFQFTYWKLYAGKFLYNSYGGNAGEGFEFLRPFTVNFLFSFRKGWLIYTPLMMFSIAGFVFLYRRNREVFTPLFLYFLFNLYVVSSWSCWWYAQSFSQRAIIASYPIMAVALGYFLKGMWQYKKSLATAAYITVAAFVGLNLFQTKQFMNGVLHGDRMTGAYYFATFGKLHATDEDKKLLMIDRSASGYESFENENEYTGKTLDVLTFEDGENCTAEQAAEGKKSYKLESTTPYSPTIIKKYREITSKDHAWIRASAYIYPTQDLVQKPFSFVIQFTHNGYAYKHKAFDSEKLNLQLNTWNKVSFDYLTPEVRRKSDVLKVYIWNRGNTILYLDSMKAEAFEKKE